MENLSVSKDFLEALIKYLANKPYIETAEMIDYLKSEIQTQWDRGDDDEPVNADSDTSAGE